MRPAALAREVTSVRSEGCCRPLELRHCRMESFSLWDLRKKWPGEVDRVGYLRQSLAHRRWLLVGEARCEAYVEEKGGSDENRGGGDEKEKRESNRYGGCVFEY